MGLSTWKCSYSGMYLQILTLDTSPDSEVGKTVTGGARIECGLLPRFAPALTCEECPRGLRSPVWKAKLPCLWWNRNNGQGPFQERGDSQVDISTRSGMKQELEEEEEARGAFPTCNYLSLKNSPVLSHSLLLRPVEFLCKLHLKTFLVLLCSSPFGSLPVAV